MSITIGPPAVDELRPKITVIGVGGAGGNAVGNMIAAQIEGVDFIATNTDAQALNNSAAQHRIQLGPDITQGLGAGSRPEVGRAAAEETLHEIDRALDGAHMCFIAAGMGGGTGTGAAPVIAKAARDKGVLTVGVVTKPFLFEGTRRMRAAEAGIEELQKHVDTLIVIPNQNLFLVAKAETTFKEAFLLADEVLQQGVRSITDLMVMPGLINLDFADVRSVMGEMGKAMMGTGEGHGENRALEAAERAIANPLLDGVSMQGAKGVIISIIGGDDMRLLEVDEAANHIRELVDPNANIIWGSAFNPELQGKIRVSVVATGIEQTGQAVESNVQQHLGSGRGPARAGLGGTGLGGDRAARRSKERVEPEAPIADTVAEHVAEPIVKPAEPELDKVAEQADATPAKQPLDLGEALGLKDNPVAEPEPAAEQADASAQPYQPYQPTFGQPALAQGKFSVPDYDGAEQDKADELILDNSTLAQPEPEGEASPLMTRRRGLVSHDAPDSRASGTGLGGLSSGGGASHGGGSSGGSGGASSGGGGGGTLFERMANLSRGRSKAQDPVDDNDDDDAGAISIPRFLGRQNNQ